MFQRVFSYNFSHNYYLKIENLREIVNALCTNVILQVLNMGIVEKIQEIEHEISRTQKNKATEYHLGLLKAKLAKYRQQLLEPTTKGGTSKGDGFDVMKSGDARVAMVSYSIDL